MSPGKYQQIGIASFVSSGGCENEYPHGFTRVTHYLEWIATQTGINVEKWNKLNFKDSI